jgi:eukaryotic-like serine/threonine-protein kinase
MLHAGTRLGPYEIEASLGAGGMGEVYLARDTRLGRQVAVKVLPDAVSHDRERRDRFDREARAVAALSHPNICALFDVGSEGSTHYLVMEHVEGPTLAERLEAGPLPMPEAVRLGAQIAGGLAAAHDRRIIHRDLKPANLKLAAAGVKILDFGLAKFLEDEADPIGRLERTTEMATARHVIMGTVPYMSPEQARAKPVDHRSDAWGFGVVLHEMLTGRMLFGRESAADVLAAILHADLGLDALPRETPAAVRALLGRLLDRDLDRRLGDLHEVRRILEAAAGGSAGVVEAAGPAERDVKSLVVLPFENVSPDAENEYFSDGLTEEVIADLSRIRALRVISRTTAMRLKGTAKPLAEVGRELDVQYALEGSVRKAAGNLRITVRLIDIRTDAPLWSEKYGGTLEDIFSIQEQVSRSIADSLRVRLTAEEDQELVARPAPNAYAFDTYLRTRRDIWSFVPERMERARKELVHALAVVGEDPFLHAGLALVNWQYINAGISGDRTYLAQATLHARKVAELEPAGAQGPRLLGLICAQDGDLVGWVRHLGRAYEIDPHDPYGAVFLGFGWTFAGHPHRARPIFEKLLSVDPQFDYLLFGMAFDAYFAGDYERVESLCEQSRRLSPDHPGIPMVLAQTLASAGQIERAVRVVEEQAAPPEAHPLAALTHILRHALLGEAASADALATEAWAEKVWSDFQYTHLMAQAQAILGRRDEALRWLTRATERGLIHHPFLAERDPLLASLRGDPRFADLLESVRTRWERFERDVAAS